VTYGSAELPTAFSCTVTAVVPNQVTCTLGQAAGKDLRFLVTVDGVSSNVGADLLTYPSPTITPLTLQTPFTNKTAFLTSQSNAGGTVLFRGTNFGTQTFIAVKLGPNNAPDKYTCAVQFSPAPMTLINCTVPPGGGWFNKFKVYVGPGTSAISVRGTDTFNYAW
jgi:hypothetical protein